MSNHNSLAKRLRARPKVSYERIAGLGFAEVRFGLRVTLVLTAGRIAGLVTTFPAFLISRVDRELRGLDVMAIFFPDGVARARR